MPADIYDALNSTAQGRQRYEELASMPTDPHSVPAPQQDAPDGGDEWEAEERVIRNATAGPWHVADGAMEGFDGHWDVVSSDWAALASMSTGGIVAKRPESQLEANAEFIARARTAWPRDRAALRDAEARCKRLE